MRSKTKFYLSFGVVFIGVVLEHLDMMLVNLYATSMTRHFITAKTTNQAVLLGFLGYSISFLFRPLGAAFFGLVGDAVGRKPSMVFSLVLMSAATLGLGLIPNYEKIGFYSTALFVLCRICQGLSVGGEYGTALTYSYEVSGRMKTTAGALVISATHVGGLLAALFATFYAANFQASFKLIGFIGLLCFGLRSFLVESKADSERNSSVKEILRKNRGSRLAYRRAFVIASALVFTFYGSVIYLNEVIFQKGLATRYDIFYSNCVLLTVWTILPPFIAFAVDRLDLSYQRVMAIGATAVTLFSGPILMVSAQNGTFRSLFLAQLLIGILHILYCFGTPRYLGDQFDEGIRSTGVAFSYSLGASFTAALTPFICHGIVSIFGDFEAIALPICLFSGLAAVQLIFETRSYSHTRELGVRDI
jgi:MHS family proline/betaine transporter-like MFS transporter